MFEKVCGILAELTQVRASDMTMDSLLVSDLDMNSLDTINAVVRFEEEFHIEIPDRVIFGIRTVGDIVRYLETEEYKGE